MNAASIQAIPNNRHLVAMETMLNTQNRGHDICWTWPRGPIIVLSCHAPEEMAAAILEAIFARNISHSFASISLSTNEDSEHPLGSTRGGYWGLLAS